MLHDFVPMSTHHKSYPLKIINWQCIAVVQLFNYAKRTRLCFEKYRWISKHVFLLLFPLSANKRLVYEEIKKAVERDRSMVRVSELSKHGLMEITRKRVCFFNTDD